MGQENDLPGLTKENWLFISIRLAMWMPNSAFVHAVWAGARVCSIREQDFNDVCFFNEQPHAALETLLSQVHWHQLSSSFSDWDTRAFLSQPTNVYISLADERCVPLCWRTSISLGVEEIQLSTSEPQRSFFLVWELILCMNFLAAIMRYLTNVV